MKKTTISIAAPAASFKKPVELTFSNGEKSTVIFDFKYRTREQYGEFKDELDKKVVPQFATYTEAFQYRNNADAELVLSIANGWDLSDPFTKESLTALFNQYPAAGTEIVLSYDEAIALGRLKN